MNFCFGLGDPNVIGCSDADFTNDHDDRKSNGDVFLFGGGALSWSSKKQLCVSRHTTDPEYVGCSIAAIQAILIILFVEILKIYTRRARECVL